MGTQQSISPARPVSQAGPVRVAGPASPASDAARTVAAALGVCVGISGLDHGIFEVLQGDTATPGVFIQAIGPEQVMWPNGTEDAFTIVPNFLATGILSILVGLAMIVWSLRFLDRAGASRVYLALGGLLFLVGGGIGMLVFLLPGWLVARRIGRPSPRWTTTLPAQLGATIARNRPLLIGTGFVLYGLALWIAVTGYVPLLADPGLCLALCWGSMLAMLGLFLVALLGPPAPGRLVTGADA